MKRLLRASMLGALVALAALAAGAAPARAVAVSSGNGSGLAGQTVDVDVNTVSVTGLNVVSFTFDLAYNNTVITAVDVIPTGGLAATAGWSAFEFHVTNNSTTGTIHVSAAGSTPLSGAGSLLKVRFTIDPDLLNGGSSSLTLSRFVFNEGTPSAERTNGSFSVGVTPQINVSPDVGEIIRTQTLNFSVSGSVTNPVTWTTSNAAIATINSSGVLTGVAPGTVTVTATDAAAHSSTTTGVITVRGMGLTAGTTTVVVGQSVTLPITVTSLNGLGIRAGQFTLTFPSNVLQATGVTTPIGTLLNGWGPVGFGAGTGKATVDFAGSTDLTGSGVLCYVTFATVGTGYVGVTMSSATFNETLTAYKTNGSVNVTPIPTITVNPDQVTLLAGQTQQFTVSGSPTLPITWSVEDPTVATITPGGLLTAVHGGTTRVHAVDAVGAEDYTTMLDVYDFRVTVGSTTGPAGGTVRVYLTSDRVIGALDVRSLQFDMTWNSAYVTGGRTNASGLWIGWAPNGLQSHFQANKLTVAAAGSTAMPNSGPEIASLLFDLSPSTPIPTDIPLTLTRLVFNEGSPRALITNGTLRVRSTTDIEASGPLAFGLGVAEPNPVRTSTRIPFTLPSGRAGGEHVRLAVFGVDGGRVRTLLDGPLGPGAHEAAWDGRDDAGRALSAGLYFTRLEWAGRVATRKVTLVR